MGMMPMRTSNDQRLLRAQAALTNRDLRLLGWLYDHGVLTTDQIAAALFPSLGFCQRRLLKLVGLGVLTRFRPQRWEGGSFPYHYLLDQLVLPPGQLHIGPIKALALPLTAKTHIDDCHIRGCRQP